MASAMALEKFLAKSPYLPSFEDLTRSRHRGSAMARISASVFSMMFTIRNQVITGRLLHGVLAGLRIATRNGQHVPVCVVHFHGVAPVVIARPAGLLAEQRVLRDALGGTMTVLQLPRAQQLVKILRGQALEVFLHDPELL